MRAQSIRPPRPADTRLIAPKNRSQRRSARLRQEWTTHCLFYSFDFLTKRVRSVDWVSQTAGVRGSIYSAHLQCVSPLEKANAKTVANLTI
jgi:hypothetical protein